ncbi:MAG: helix-turn-helix domain-containing protein [Actinomycetota bacterium]
MSDRRTSPLAVGRRLRRLRHSRGLTQMELAAPAYTHAYVSTIEAGRRTPSPKAIDHFARKLGVDAEEILTGRPSDLPATLALRTQEARMLLSHGQYDKSEEMLRAIVKRAKTHELHRLRANGETGLGLAAERQGKTERALGHYQEADRLLASEPSHVRAEVVAGIARCFQMMGDVRYAIHILETYLITLQKNGLDDPVARMRTYASLVWPYSEIGLYDKASHVAFEALRLEPRVDNLEQVASMHTNVARELLRVGKITDALQSLKRAEDLYQTLDWRTDAALARMNRGIVFADRGDLEEAKAELQLALQTLKGSPEVVNHARALNELGRVQRLLGETDEAARVVEQSISLLGESDVTELALAHRELGLCNKDSDPPVAEKNLREAIELYRRADEKLHIAGTLRELGDLLCAQGDIEAGRDAYREGLLSLGDRP